MKYKVEYILNKYTSFIRTSSLGFENLETYSSRNLFECTKWKGRNSKQSVKGEVRGTGRGKS